MQRWIRVFIIMALLVLPVVIVSVDYLEDLVEASLTVFVLLAEIIRHFMTNIQKCQIKYASLTTHARTINRTGL
jgi:hypothetical protein